MHVGTTERQLPIGDGLVLHWVEAGRGEALLLLHGGHGGLVHWRANIEGLSRDHRVLAPDLPGFGASGDPGRCFTPQEHAKSLARWMEQLEVRLVSIVGFSFGSLVALALGLERPALVSSLVLVNPPGVGPRSAEAQALPERMSALARQHGHRAGIEGTLRELMLSKQVLVTPELVDLMEQAARNTKHLTRSMSRASQTLEQLQQLRVPARVLIGQRDPFHSNDLEGRKRAIDAVLGAGATHVVADAAHWLQYDNPQAFAGELRQFLRSLDPQQETL